MGKPERGRRDAEIQLSTKLPNELPSPGSRSRFISASKRSGSSSSTFSAKKTTKKKCGERLVTTGNEQGINFECLREVRLWASALSEGVKTEMAEYRWRVREVIWAIDQCRYEIMT